MKGRTVKLREAHKSSVNNSLCTVIWDSDATHLVTASSSDPSVLIHEPVSVLQQPSSSKNQVPPANALRYHKDGVTSIALSPDSLCLASGSIDHSVKLHDFPSGEFQSNVTRFTLPIRSLAFNKSGSLLAAAGDDDGIKLIATIDSSISQVLKGHKASVTGLSFDPNNEYLASVDFNGTVIFWQLSSGKPVHELKRLAPDCGVDTSVSNVLSWSPDGETLAVPGLRNDVVMYDRDTAEKMFSLKGEHEKRVCFMSWSPNGKYMATSGLDKQILIWDIDLRQDIERQKFEDSISCLSWQPNGNALAVIDATGKFGVWDCPVPTCMKSPVDGALDRQSVKTSGFSLFDDDAEEEEEHSNYASLDIGGGENNYDGSASVRRKRLLKQSLPDEDLDDDSDGQEGLLRQIESRKRAAKHKEGSSSKKEDGVSDTVRAAKTKMQAAFQPCSTPAQSGKRHFLCYNMLGSITTIENEGYSHIEVDYHDTGRGSRVPSMTDYFGFTMASLSETGSVFANPCKGEKKTSTLMYRPFSSWANNSEWSMRFEAEEVKVVALGHGWVAAITDNNLLRIFTEGGLQKYILSLNGPAVTAAGFNDELAVVTHVSDCLSSGDQVFDVKVFNVSSGTLPVSCRLPLTPTSTLSWFGFSEEGHLSAYDSKGVLRVFTDIFGGSWLPLFSSDKVKRSEDENHWVVGLNASKLFCIVCKPPDLYPTVGCLTAIIAHLPFDLKRNRCYIDVMPKPVLTLFSLSFPLASSDLGAGDLENELMFCSLHISQIQEKIEELGSVGLDTSVLDDDAFDLEASRDRCILRLIANCCNGDKLVRATELAKLLSLEKSIKGAIKLVTALKLPMLAEKFNSILEERLSNESVKSVTASYISGATNLTIGELKGAFQMTGRSGIAVPIISQATAKSPPDPLLTLRSNTSRFCKQEKAEVKSKVEEQKEPRRSTKELEKVEEKSKLENHKSGPSQRSHSQKQILKKIELSKSSSNGDSVDKPNLYRPPNPFAKAPNNQEKTSLLDSLKKTKKEDDENKGVSNKKLKV